MRTSVRGTPVKLAALASSALLLLGACASSPPMHFYTLSALPAGQNAASRSASNGLRVARVRIPGELDRTEIVQRIDANRLRIAEQDRWAAPLDDMIRRVLSSNLQARGGPSASADATVSVDIEEFVGDTNCAVTLRASWEQKAGDAARVRNGREVITVPAPSSSPCAAGALPAVMSEALARLSDKILAPAP